MSEPLKIPDGWKLVPVEPTPAMIELTVGCGPPEKRTPEEELAVLNRVGETLAYMEKLAGKNPRKFSGLASLRRALFWRKLELKE